MNFFYPFLLICDALRDLVAFVPFKKREKHPWRSVTFTACNLLKVTILQGCFSRFLNCKNATKSRNAFHLLIVYVRFYLFSVSTCLPAISTSFYLFTMYQSFILVLRVLILSSTRLLKASQVLFKLFLDNGFHQLELNHH